MAVLELKQVTKTFGTGSAATEAVKPLDLSVAAGEFIILTGPSGSGKTTLLTMMGGLLTPTSGQVLLNGQDLAQMKEKERSKVRFNQYGFILQASNLIPFLTVDEQFKLVDKLSKQDHGDYADQLLTALGITEERQHFPNKLSGGQKQRVAIARALYNHPAVIFADEPTAALDSKRAAQVVQTLQEQAKQHHVAVIMVTHDDDLLKDADHVYEMVDGQLQLQK
ncbi:ABC transporter family protein [Lactobacillus selangorensis]|uniref:Putative hemin import ATP-binding protein HrtA n=1 Tax=Lactobacillus selangorensis TaxID=81857 RepID=A0A0R2FXC9_9LACO|nr:ABC transporter ATP-binding protein [Lactobacillus selangorensis]KRN28758.1 ABC transporter family protein [Lactobacillus selangorensis]KRN32832.1 ABC transporter family protein [Lactobacillus selangorensis]